MDEFTIYCILFFIVVGGINYLFRGRNNECDCSKSSRSVDEYKPLKPDWQFDPNKHYMSGNVYNRK